MWSVAFLKSAVLFLASIFIAPCKCEVESRIIAYQPRGIYVTLPHYNIIREVIFYGKLNATFHDPSEADFVLNDFAKVGEEFVNLNEEISLTNGTLYFQMYIKCNGVDDYVIVDSERIVLVPLPISITAYEPHGFHITVPYGDGVEGFVIWANVNTPIVSTKHADIRLSAFEPTNGLWMAEDEDTQLFVNDTLYYDLQIRRNGKVEKYSNLPVLQIKELVPLATSTEASLSTAPRITVTTSRSTTSTPVSILSSPSHLITSRATATRNMASTSTTLLPPTTAEVVGSTATSTISWSTEITRASTTNSGSSPATRSTWTSPGTSTRTTPKSISVDTTTTTPLTPSRSATTNTSPPTSTTESDENHRDKQEQCFRQFSECINAIVEPCDKRWTVSKEDSNHINSATTAEKSHLTHTKLLTPTATLITKPRAGLSSTTEQHTPRNVLYYRDRGTTRTAVLYSASTEMPEAVRRRHPYFNYSLYPSSAKTLNLIHTTPSSYKFFSRLAFERTFSTRRYGTSYVPHRSMIWSRQPTTEGRYFNYPSRYSTSTASPIYNTIPNIIAYCPSGLQVTLPFSEGIEEFHFWANINKTVDIKNNATVKLSAFETTNGVWSALDQQIQLSKGDVLHYILYVRRRGMLNTLPQIQFLITDVAINTLDKSFTRRKCSASGFQRTTTWRYNF